jgi:hypothetical protein
LYYLFYAHRYLDKGRAGDRLIEAFTLTEHGIIRIGQVLLGKVAF